MNVSLGLESCRDVNSGFPPHPREPFEVPLIKRGEPFEDGESAMELLRGAFSDPAVAYKCESSDKLIDDYFDFLRSPGLSLEQSISDAYLEVENLLKRGTPGDGEMQSLFFLTEDKRAALWIDDAARRVTIIDVTAEGLASAPCFEECGGDKIRGTLPRQDRRSQLFREYSNLIKDEQKDELQAIRQFALSGNMAEKGTEQCALKIENYLMRESPDLARNFYEEPDLFMKSNKAPFGKGCDRLKFLSVLTELALKKRGVAGEAARMSRHKIKLLWQLDLMERNLKGGEALKGWRGPTTLLESALQSCARSAEELFDKGALSEAEAVAVRVALSTYRSAIERHKKIENRATDQIKAKEDLEVDSAAVEEIPPEIALFDAEAFSVEGELPLDPIPEASSNHIAPLSKSQTLVGAVAAEFNSLVESGDIAKIDSYLSDLLPLAVMMKRRREGRLAADLAMQVLLALPKPKRSEETIWSRLTPGESQALAATIQKWFSLIPAIFKGTSIANFNECRIARSSFEALQALSDFFNDPFYHYSSYSYLSDLDGQGPRAPIAYFTLYAILFELSKGYFGMPKEGEANNDELLALLQSDLFSVKEGKEHEMMWEVASYLIPELSMELLIRRRENEEQSRGLYARKHFAYDENKKALPALEPYRQYVYPKVSSESKELLAIAHLKVATHSLLEDVEAKNFASLAGSHYYILSEFMKSYKKIYGKERFGNFLQIVPAIEHYIGFNKRLQFIRGELYQLQSPERELQTLEVEKRSLLWLKERAEEGLLRYERYCQNPSFISSKSHLESRLKVQREEIVRIERAIADKEQLRGELTLEIEAAKGRVEEKERKIEELEAEREQFAEQNIEWVRSSLLEMKKLLLEVPFDEIFEREKHFAADSLVQQNLAQTLFIEEPEVDAVNSALIAATFELSSLLLGSQPISLKSEKNLSLLSEPIYSWHGSWHWNRDCKINLFERIYEEGNLFSLPDSGVANMDFLVRHCHSYSDLQKYPMNARVDAYQAIDSLTALLSFYGNNYQTISEGTIRVFRKLLLGFAVPLHAENIKESIPTLLSALSGSKIEEGEATNCNVNTLQGFFARVMRDPDYSKEWADSLFLELYSLLHDLFDQLAAMERIDGALYNRYLDEIESGYIDAELKGAFDEENQTYDMVRLKEAVTALNRRAIEREVPESPFAKVDPKRLWKIVAREQFAAYFAKERTLLGCEKALSYVDFDAMEEGELSELMNSTAAPFLKGGAHEALLSSYQWVKEKGYLICEPLNLKMNSITGVIDQIKNCARSIPYEIKCHTLFRQAFPDREPSAQYVRKSGSWLIDDREIYKLRDPVTGLTLLYEYPSYGYIGSDMDRFVEEGSAKVAMQREGKTYRQLTGPAVVKVMERVPSAFHEKVASSFWVEVNGEGEGSLLVLDGMKRPLLRGRLENGRIRDLYREGREGEVAKSASSLALPFDFKRSYPLEFWADVASNRKRLEIHGTRFSFDIDSEENCHWSGNRDFTICEEIEGELPHFLQQRDHLLLSDKQGHRKALIIEGGAETLLEVDIADGALSSPERSTMIKLVEGYIAEGRYDRAIELLQDSRLSGFDTTSPPLTEDERRRLKALLNEPQALAHPLYSTALLRVYYVLMRNARIYRAEGISRAVELDLQDRDAILKECLPIAFYSLYMKTQQQAGDLGFTEEEIKSISQSVDELLERTKEGIFKGMLTYLNTLPPEYRFVGEIAGKIFELEAIKSRLLDFVEGLIAEKIELSRDLNRAVRESGLLAGRRVREVGFLSSLLGTAFFSGLRILEREGAKLPLERALLKFAEYFEKSPEVDLSKEVEEPCKGRKFFENNYFTLYHIAKEGTAEERERLRTLLAFSDDYIGKGMPPEGKQELSPEIALLVKVIRNPGSFPSIQEMKELYVARNLAKSRSDRKEAKARGKKRRLVEAKNVIKELLTFPNGRIFSTVGELQAEIGRVEREIERLKGEESPSLVDEMRKQKELLESYKGAREEIQKCVDRFNATESGEREWEIDKFVENADRRIKTIDKELEDASDILRDAQKHLNCALLNERYAYFDALSALFSLFSLVAVIISTFAEIFKRAYRAAKSPFEKSALQRAEKMLKNAKPIELFALPEKARSDAAAGRLRECVDRDRGFDTFIDELSKDHFYLEGPSAEEKREWFDNSFKSFLDNRESCMEAVRSAIENRSEIDLPFVEENFVALYAVARDVREREKKLLAELLVGKVSDAIHEEGISIESSLPHLLLRVIDNPSEYPSMETLSGMAGRAAAEQIIAEIGLKRVGREELDRAFFDKKALEECFANDRRFSEKRQGAIYGKISDYNKFRKELVRKEHRFAETNSREEIEGYFAKKIATSALHGELLAHMNSACGDFYKRCFAENASRLAELIKMPERAAQLLLQLYSQYVKKGESVEEMEGVELAKELELTEEVKKLIRESEEDATKEREKELLLDRGNELFTCRQELHDCFRESAQSALAGRDPLSSEEEEALNSTILAGAARLFSERTGIDAEAAGKIYAGCQKGGVVESPEGFARLLTLSEEEKEKLQREERERIDAREEALLLEAAKILLDNREALEEMSLKNAQELLSHFDSDSRAVADLYNREKMLGKLEEKIAAEELAMEALKCKLLAKAELETGEKYKLRHLSEGRRIDSERLSSLILKNGAEELMAELGIKEEVAQDLLVMMAERLIVGTRLNHLRLLSGLLLQGRPQNELYEAMQSLKRSYLPFEEGEVDFSKLYFELYKEYNIRGDQMKVIRAIADLKNEKEMVVEAPTGFGKTDAVIPLAARMVAEQGKLAILCWPSSLVQENAADLGRSFMGAFGSKATAMHFERDSNLHSKTLELIYQDLFFSKKYKIPVNLTAESLKSFMLHYHTLLDDLYTNRKSGDEELLKELALQAEYFAKTLKLLKEESVIFIDESHASLHPKDRLIYSIGERKKLPPKLIETFDKVMEKFFSREVDGRAIEELLAERRALAIKEKREELAKETIDLLIAALPFTEEVERQRVKEFIANGSPNPFRGEKRIEAPKEVKEEVYLYKGLFGDRIFTDCLEMSHNEQYGLSHKHLTHPAEGSMQGEGERAGKRRFKRCSFAIPYSSAQTPTESDVGPSQYANHHKTMLLTYLTYFTQGLFGEGDDIEGYQVVTLMRELYEEAEAEKLRREASRPGFTIRDTAAYRFFNRVAPEEMRDKLTKKGIKNLSIEQVKAMHEAMKGNREVILRFIKDVVLPEIETYPETLDCTFANFLSMFDKKVMMSATPMDPASYRIDAGFFASKDTANRALEKMMLCSVDEELIETIPGGSSKEVLGQVEEVIQRTADCCALIDLAGLFKDVTNKEVARALNESPLDEKEIEQVTYYDPKMGFVKVVRGSDVAVKDDVKELEKRFVYFDQPRSIGSDIVLKKEGVAIALVSPELPFTKVAQAIGRMRQLGMDQKVRFVVPENMLRESSVTKKELIAHWEVELNREEESRNTMSLQQQIDDLLQASLQKAMIEKRPEEMARFYSDNRAFFVTPIDIRAEALYGSDTVTESGINMLLAHIKVKAKEVGELSGVSGEEKARIKGKLKELKRALNAIKLKEEVRIGARSSGTFQAEQQSETQIIKEIQLEQERVNQYCLVPEESKDYSYRPWAGSVSLTRLFKPRDSGSMSERVPFRRVLHPIMDSEEGKYSKIGELFDKNLLSSINFWHEGQKLYSNKQKPFHSYLVQMKDEGEAGKSFTATIVEETEAHAIEKRFNRGEVGDGGAKVALFNLKSGFVIGDEIELTHPKLARLTSQIKLLSANFANELSDAEAKSLQFHPFLYENEENKKRLFKFLADAVRSKDDKRCVDNADKRYRQDLPRILQILDKGKSDG